MGFRIEDNCVMCGIGCIHCGRDHEEVHYCDKCETYSEYMATIGFCTIIMSQIVTKGNMMKKH